MKTNEQTYIGLFISCSGHQYKLSVDCNGTIQAFILLTADAIRKAYHYQLSEIMDEEGNITKVDDLLKISSILN